MHTRQLIRETVEAEIKKVPGFKLIAIGRRHALDEMKQIPAAVIYTDRESQEQISQRPRRYIHTVELKVSYYVKTAGGTKGENALDDLAEAIEPFIIDGLDALEQVRRVVPAEWDIDDDGATNGDYLNGVRLYLVEYDSQEPPA